MIIEETHVNATEGYMLGEPQRIALEDTIFDGTEPEKLRGEIYRFARSEYGRCTSKVYVDTDTGPVAVGWVFVKRERYEDSPETYLHETWVTLLERYAVRVEKDYAGVTS